MTSDNLFLWDVEGKERSVVNHPTTPLDLAMVLKKTLSKTHSYEHADVMDEALAVMRQFSSESWRSQIPTIQVSKSLIDMMRGLLLSETLSDITFVCPDGSRLPAHKCILSAASDYFRAVFNGPWAENNPNGEWTTENSGDVMKGVLTFIYTGKEDTSLMQVEPEAMLSVASEYGIVPLMELAERCCIRRLTPSNLKEMLQLADLRSSTTLKEACFDYVHQRGASLLAEPQFLSLASEDPQIWKELTFAIASLSGPASKRRRCA